LYFQFAFASFSSLHSQNQLIYHHLNAWNSQHIHRSMRVAPTKLSTGNQKLSSVQDNVIRLFQRNNSVKFSLKTNLFLQSISGNQLGFTSGRIYHFTKFKFVENML